jgi:hypothetical protein
VGLNKVDTRELDEWMIREACRLQFENGHNWGNAWLLARYSRDMIQVSLERSQPPCVVVGI